MSLTDRGDTYLKFTTPNRNSPDVLEGNWVQLFGTNIRESFGKDITYIALPKTYPNHFEGGDTLALDFLKTDFSFEINATIYGTEDIEASGSDGRDGKHSLPPGILNGNGNATVNSESLMFNTVGSTGSGVTSHEWVLLGATKIKHDSEEVRNTTDAKNLVPGDTEDYRIDYDRGRIELLNNTHGHAVGDNYEISYTAAGDAYNIARIIRRMAQLGGNATLRTDGTGFTTSGGSTSYNEYMVEFDNVEIVRTPERPHEIEIIVECRVALDRT